MSKPGQCLSLAHLPTVFGKQLKFLKTIKEKKEKEEHLDLATLQRMFTIEEVKKGKFRIMSDPVKPTIPTGHSRKLNSATPELEEQNMSSSFADLKSEVLGAVTEMQGDLSTRMTKIEKKAIWMEKAFTGYLEEKGSRYPPKSP